MKVKTARRFLKRNSHKIFKHKAGIEKQSPSFIKQCKACIKIILDHSRGGDEK